MLHRSAQTFDNPTVLRTSLSLYSLEGAELAFDFTGRPRGFGFVVFEDAAVADKVVSAQHTIDRREVGSFH